MNFRTLPEFEAAFAKVVREHRYLLDELNEVVAYVAEYGSIPDAYRPHRLVLANTVFSGFWEFHLSDVDDVLVIYSLTKTEFVLMDVTDHKHL
jgi:mRNA-degrading endonuclease YafQ of YafQ-DinJ toxin-antitoxin module